jgi:transposase
MSTPTRATQLVGDELWAAIQPLLPPKRPYPRGGRPWIVRALVYRSAYALAVGESLGELQGRFPDSDLAAGLVHTTYPPRPPPGRAP